MKLNSHLYDWQYKARQWTIGRLCALRQRPPSASFAESPAEPTRVLLIVAGMLGDSVMCTPVIVEARRLWPQAKITLLGQRHNCELLSACPLIDACVETPAIPFTIRRQGEIKQLKDWLQEQQFDVVIILLGDQFASLLAKVGIPTRVGVEGHALAPCLTHTYDIGGASLWGPSEKLNALRTLGYEVPDGLPRLWVAEAARDSARQQLTKLGLAAARPYAVVHPFGSLPRKWWPIERVEELAAALWRDHELKTVVVGGPETRNQLPQHAATNVVDATGALSIQELLAVIDSAALVVTTDSGPFHIAGALRRPLIGLFPARRPQHANRYPKARIAFGKDAQCEKRCKWDYCQAVPCRQLNALSIAQVLNAAQHLQAGAKIKVESR